MSELSHDVPESLTPSEPAQAPVTAGSLLKQARVAKGLHIAVLAASIKVTPRKLELLEADRYDELPGATFTRALAQTVCRTLKTDPAPVLALLPLAAGMGLSHMSTGLNEPFRDKPGRRVPRDLSLLKSPIRLAAAVLLVASVVVYVLPAGWVSQLTQGAAVEAPQSSPVPQAAEMVPMVEPTLVPAAPTLSATPGVALAAPLAASAAEAAASSASASAAAQVAPVGAVEVPAASGALLLRAQATSWIEVIDGRGNTLLSRVLAAEETVELDGPTPLRVKIGNAAGTQVSFRGRPVDLGGVRDNVARLELR